MNQIDIIYFVDGTTIRAGGAKRAQCVGIFTPDPISRTRTIQLFTWFHFIRIDFEFGIESLD